MQREVGFDALRARPKDCRMMVETGEQILELCSPMREDREFDPGASRPASPQLEQLFDRARTGGAPDRRADLLSAGELVVTPGKTGRRVEQPVVSHHAQT